MRAENAEIPVSIWSQEAEQAVIGGLLADSLGKWDHVGSIVREEDFYSPLNGRIFTVIAGLTLAAKPVDIVTVHDALAMQGEGESIDLAGLLQLSHVPWSGASMTRYAEIVVERAMMRRLLAASDEVREIAVAPGMTVAARIDRAQSKFAELQVGNNKTDAKTIGAYAVSFLDRLQALADGTVEPGIPTQITLLDRMLSGGLRGGKQMILAARPSVGKSSLAMQLCINLARAGHPSAFFSMEMGGDELTDRATASIGRIKLDGLLTGKLDEDEWTRVTEAVETYRSLPLLFDESSSLSIHEIASKARRLKRLHGLKFLVVDYIQLCSSGKPKDSRHHQLEEISRGLKALARELDITILTLSQLNREVEKRTSGRPVLADLKESGAIEEDADVVMLLWRHNDEGSGQFTIGCDIAKNRQGRIGEMALHFDAPVQRWTESMQPLQKKQAGKTSYTDDI